MATFMEDLWNSIFTPGPTPTLLLATNASFAALQVVLIHFVILSFICGGLWCAINWFAAEVAASRKEEEKEEKQQADKDNDKTGSDNDDNAAGTQNAEVSVSTDNPHTEPEPAAVTSSREADGARPRLVSSPSSGNMSADSDWERVEEVEN
ncbi:hypothetical protein KEM56_006565 [Ascosphaera pollenicola]|nr:hypothetical protein KEM56_006565 [Ascosphaera pollenicola]